MPTISTSIMVAPYVYQIENSQIFFGLDLESGFYWVSDYAKRMVVSGDFDTLEDAEGTAYEYLFNYADKEFLHA